VEELGMSAVQTQQVQTGHEEAVSDQPRRTLVALETVVVPVTPVERPAQTWLITHNSTVTHHARFTPPALSSFIAWVA